MGFMTCNSFIHSFIQWINRHTEEQNDRKRDIGRWTTEICILLYIGKKAGILASWKLFIGILLMEIGILVTCLSLNLYIGIYCYFEICYIGISYPLFQSPRYSSKKQLIHSFIKRIYLEYPPIWLDWCCKIYKLIDHTIFTKWDSNASHTHRLSYIDINHSITHWITQTVTNKRRFWLLHLTKLILTEILKHTYFLYSTTKTKIYQENRSWSVENYDQENGSQLVQK